MWKEIVSWWHLFWYSYHNALLTDCLDHQLKKKLVSKAQFHKTKSLSA